MERKSKIGIALFELEYLLDNDFLIESQYQKFLEQNPIVLEILGYSEFHPMVAGGVELERDKHTGLKPEPDFIVKNDLGLYEIFEIKTPVEKKLITGNNYRKKFTSEVNSYISQTVTYEKYFSRNPDNRISLQKNHNILIQENLDIKIVYGRNKLIDKKQIHSKCREYSWKIDIITYDDILDKLKKYYNDHYGIYEDLKGYSFHFIVRFHKHKTTGYLIDVGANKEENRLSFFIDTNNDFNFVAFDNSKRKHILTIEGENNNLIDNWVYLMCELGNSNNGFVMSLSIDGIEKQKIIKDTPIKINSDLIKMYQGCSIFKRNFGIFDIGEEFICSRTLNNSDKYNTIGYFIQKYGQDLEVKSYLEYSGNQFMIRDKLSMNQDDKKHQPKYRKEQ